MFGFARRIASPINILRAHKTCHSFNTNRLISTKAKKAFKRQRQLAKRKKKPLNSPAKTINGNITPVFSAAQVTHMTVPKEESTSLFAVLALSGTQFKVTIGDLIVVNKIRQVEADVGKTLDLTDVLLVGSKNETIIGRPLVENASVKVLIQEQSQDKKIIVFKRRRRKNSMTWKGHRRKITLLRVLEISCPQIEHSNLT